MADQGMVQMEGQSQQEETKGMDEMNETEEDTGEEEMEEELQSRLILIQNKLRSVITFLS